MCAFEDFFNLHPTPTWIYSVRSLRILAVNDAAVRSYGYTRYEFLTMTIEQIRPAEDVPKLRNHLEHLRCADHLPSIWRHRRKNGACIDVEIESSSVQFNGEPARLVAARDITEQISNIQRLNLAMSGAQVGVWEYRPSDHSVSWDPTHSGVYGIDRSLFPKSQSEFLEMVEPQYRSTLEDAMWRCVELGELYDCEFQLNIPGKGLRWRHAIGKRIGDAAGIKVVGIGIDVTERKKLEEQIHRSQKLEAVGRLAGGIAHDFNNVLTVIGGYAHLMKDHSDSEFISSSAGEVSKAAERAARLVRQLLDFSRKEPLDPRPIDIAPVVSETMDLIRRLLPESLVLVYMAIDRSIRVSADPGQIEQLVMNLCLNARDAMDGDGMLKVQVSSAEKRARIIVSDTGPGITPEVQKRMFEPFFSTKEVGVGTGLGLSIVHSIVNQLRGSIDVQTSPEIGSTFVITLPVCDDATIVK